jgi:hypothetical protein
VTLISTPSETYNLACLPELNDVDELFTKHNWECQGSDDLRPSSVS